MDTEKKEAIEVVFAVIAGKKNEINIMVSISTSRSSFYSDVKQSEKEHEGKAIVIPVVFTDKNDGDSTCKMVKSLIMLDAALGAEAILEDIFAKFFEAGFNAGKALSEDSM